MDQRGGSASATGPARRQCPGTELRVAKHGGGNPTAVRSAECAAVQLRQQPAAVDQQSEQSGRRHSAAVWPARRRLPDHPVRSAGDPGSEPVGVRTHASPAGRQPDLRADGQPDAKPAVGHSGRQPGHAELRRDPAKRRAALSEQRGSAAEQSDPAGLLKKGS